MTPVFISEASLVSALGGNLNTASRSYAADQKPLPDLLKGSEHLPSSFFMFAQDAANNLDQQLNELLEPLFSKLGCFDDCLLVLASTTQSIQQIESDVSAAGQFNQNHLRALDTTAHELKTHWGFAASLFINTACTSAANGLLYAAKMLTAEHYDKAVVLAYETPSQTTRHGFSALGLQSTQGHYRPFHPARDGLILGEAYACTLLTKEKDHRSIGRILGGASGCDTSNISATREDGEHIRKVATEALRNAELTPESIQCIKHHGTATAGNDKAEAAFYAQMFSQYQTPACCLKPWLGHTLGACGLTETLLLMNTLNQGLALPAHPSARGCIIPLPCKPLSLEPSSHVLLNFSGFGGNNASLVVAGVSS